MLARQDYLPFGEEVPGGVGPRAGVAGYSQATSPRQKYAGMEQDDSTGMSHTPWREFDSMSARWTAPDPYGGSMEPESPQSFNRYAYCNNDPINKVDPSGLMLSDIGVTQVDSSGMASSLNYLGVHNLRYSVSEEYKKNYDALQEAKQQEQQQKQPQRQSGPVVDPFAFLKEFGHPPPAPGTTPVNPYPPPPLTCEDQLARTFGDPNGTPGAIMRITNDVTNNLFRGWNPNLPGDANPDEQHLYWVHRTVTVQLKLMCRETSSTSAKRHLTL